MIKSAVSRGKALIREGAFQWTAGLLTAVTVAHYVTPFRFAVLHSLYQHLCCVPVLLAAVKYGLVGGVTTGVVASLAYIPHIHKWSSVSPEYAVSQYTTVVFSIVLGAFVGILSEQEKRHRKELEQRSNELRKVYEELQQSVEQLKRADRLSTIGQLAASLAHEIRTPLASIEGAVEILERQDTDERRREFIPVIKKECRRLNKLLTSFLDFARPKPPHVTNVPVKVLLESVSQLIRHTADKQHITLTVSCDSASTVQIHCDPEQIKQVLVNLVLNAIQATPPGGEVVIGAERRQAEMVLWVKDNGVGVDEQNLEKIFEPFFTTKKEGTGLGLAICQRIVEQHGGKIQASRVPEGGMIFSVHLPQPIVGQLASHNSKDTKLVSN